MIDDKIPIQVVEVKRKDEFLFKAKIQKIDPKNYVLFDKENQKVWKMDFDRNQLYLYSD